MSIVYLNTRPLSCEKAAEDYSLSTLKLIERMRILAV